MVAMNIRPVARGVYALVAGVLLAAGSAVLLLGTGLLPASLSQRIRAFGGGEGVGVHLLQEMGTLLVLAGLVSLWCVRNYERSLYFHGAMTVFLGLFALVHWFDSQGSFHAGTGEVITTLPFAAYLLLGVIRSRTERPIAVP